MHAISPQEAVIPIELPCRACGEVFMPTPEALRKGPLHWWYCPACRLSQERDPEVPA